MITGSFPYNNTLPPKDHILCIYNITEYNYLTATSTSLVEL